MVHVVSGFCLALRTLLVHGVLKFHEGASISFSYVSLALLGH